MSDTIHLKLDRETAAILLRVLVGPDEDLFTQRELCYLSAVCEDIRRALAGPPREE